MQEGRALMHLFMEDPESHGARCGNTAKSCQFTTTTCIANGGGSWIYIRNFRSLTANMPRLPPRFCIHPWRGGGEASGAVSLGGEKKGERTVHV